MTDGDGELFELWRAGVQRAGEQLFSQHQQAVAGYFARRASLAAHDLVQETWLQCLKSLPTYRGEASFRTFLFAIAHNVLRHHLRGQGGRQPDLGITNVPDSEPSPASLVHRRFELGVLMRGLSELADDQRLVLELSYDEQLSSEQVGELLQIPSATVRTRIRRAKALLRENIERLTREDPRLRSSTLETFELWDGQRGASEPPD